jgi:polar amino acid transport system substrate-binding protein
MIKNIWTKWLNFSRWKKGLLLAILAVVILCIRACTGPIIPLAKQYRVIRSNDWTPLELFGREPNMAAFVDDLVTQIVDEEGLSITLTVSSTLTSQGLFQVLDLGAYDAILAVFSPNSYVKEKYIVSLPIYNAGPVLIVPVSSSAASLLDVKDKVIGIKRGSSVALQLGNSSFLLRSYDNMTSALEDLENSVIGGVVLEAELAEIYIKGFYKGKLKIATAPLTDLGLRLVARQEAGNKQLVERFNQGLAESEKNGEYENLIHKWGLTNL